MVPKLRFPEFRDSGEWKERPISDLLIEVNRPMDMVDTEDYSLVTVKRRYGGIVTRGILKGVSIKVKSQFYIQENDFLISKRQIVHNACGVVPKEFAGSIVSNEYSVLKATQDCDIAFFNYFSQQPIVSRSFLNCSIGIHIEKMLFRLNDWFKQEFLFPAIKEQQKIADCLSSLDKLITAETQKLEAYKAHKKGLMQKLFPAEGETVPEWRFPEFRGKGDWELKALGKIGENLDSKRVPITAKERIKGEVPYYGASGIVDYVEGGIFDEELLCISEDGANLVARTYPIAFSISGKTWVNNHAHVLRFSERFTQVLVENYLNSISLELFLTGMAQPKLNRSKLDIIPIPLPDLPEQQKIADCLSSLDELITAEAQKIDTLKAHKKGLMQGLFPSADEVGV